MEDRDEPARRAVRLHELHVAAEAGHLLSLVDNTINNVASRSLDFTEQRYVYMTSSEEVSEIWTKQPTSQATKLPCSHRVVSHGQEK